MAIKAANLAELAEEALQNQGERLSLDFEGQRLTNAEILARSRRLQGAFERLGVKKDFIAVMFLTNHPLVYSVFQGIFRCGGTAVPAMFQLTPAELRFVLEDTRAGGVITDKMILHKTREAVKGLDFIKWMVVLGGEDKPDATPPEYSLEGLLQGDERTSLPSISADDVALMLYTSGTTGKPKGVMLTHTNLIAMSAASTEATELERWEGPRIGMSAMPMAHIFGVGVMNGGYLTPPNITESWTVQHTWFQPEPFVKAIHEHRCNTFASVPTMLSLILNLPGVEKYDLSCVREVICGASPLPVEVARGFMEKFGCRVREIYGMTENCGIATANRLSHDYRAGSAGRPYVGCELKIFDDNDNEVPTGERGEVVTRGPATMKGYYNRDEATGETLRGGWLHTGDIGYLDEDGFLYIVDRKKDMIIRGGENIYPAELESVIYEHPGVAEAAVVGTPHPVYGEDVIAFVVPRKDAEVTEEAILGHMRERVTKFKLPSRVYFRQSLPKTGVGKILRRVLRDEIPAGDAADKGAADKA